jgi:DNA-binding MarR family transcriptional regulator
MRHTFAVTQAGPSRPARSDVKPAKPSGAGAEPAPHDPALVADATDIVRLLREVRRYVEQPQDTAMRETGLTIPQVSTLSVLFDRGPLSLKDLSRELGLSHSTVSGIVDRLERRGLARRTVDPADRRVSLIGVTDRVDAYARQGYTQSQAGRLLPALESANADQRRSIKAALTLLHSLLAAAPEP